MLSILFFSIFEQKNIEKAYFDQRLEYAAPKHRSKYTTLIFVETYALTNKNCIFLLLLVSLLRLSQRKDDPVEGWLKPFNCHNTLPTTAYWLLTLYTTFSIPRHKRGPKPPHGDDGPSATAFEHPPQSSDCDYYENKLKLGFFPDFLEQRDQKTVVLSRYCQLGKWFPVSSCLVSFKTSWDHRPLASAVT